MNCAGKSKLKTTFGKICNKYEKYRPTYPIQLYKDIVTISKTKKTSIILDIGCGSGKGCAYFAQKGHSLTCLEPNQELLSIAKKKLNSKSTSFVNSTFEDADFKDKKFSLILSAQAFHWVDFNVGERKVYDLLKPNGYFAFFWNIIDFNYSNELKKIEKLNRKYCKKFKNGKRAMLTIKKLKNSKLFVDVKKRKYTHFVNYEKNDFVELQKTFSWIVSLPKDLKENFCNELKTIIKKKVKVKYNTFLVIGKKNRSL